MFLKLINLLILIVNKINSNHKKRFIDYKSLYHYIIIYRLLIDDLIGVYSGFKGKTHIKKVI